jgi:O-antigen ligase
VAQAPFLLVLASMLIFSQMWLMLVSGPDGDPEASSLLRFLFMPAYVCILAVIALRWRAVIKGALHAPLILVMMGLVFASLTWSSNPDITSRRAVAVFFTTLGGITMGACFNWLGIARLLGLVTLIGAVGSVVMALGLPSYGVMHELFPGAWRGMWVEKNLLGDHMTQGFLFSIAAAMIDRRYRPLWLATAGLALLLVLMSTSKTSLVTLIMGCGAMGFVWLVKRGPVTAVTTSWLGVAGLAGLAALIVFGSDMLFSLLGKDATLTGRTKIWSALIRQINTRPWTGFGYSAIWDDKSDWAPMAWIAKDTGFIAHHAHNSWLEIWAGLGLIGLALWAVIFLVTWVRGIAAAYTSRGGYLVLPFLLAYSLVMLTESVVMIYNDFTWAAYVALAVRLSMGETAQARGEAPSQVRIAAP